MTPPNGVVYTLFRDSPLGIFLNYISGNKILKPKVLRDDYEIPVKYLGAPTEQSSKLSSSGEEQSLTPPPDRGSAPYSSEMLDKENTNESSTDGIIMVDWDGEDDPDNPLNWNWTKRIIVTAITSALATSGYMASAIFTPAEEQMKAYFGTTTVKLMLGLTLFVWGYGLSPLVVSTMSESPMFGGRRWILTISQFLFVILQIPTALINHIAPFAVLRLLAGIFVGPSLTISAGYVTDMVPFPTAAYVVTGWACGIVMGPYLGPLIGAALTHANTWRWAFWYLLIQGGVSLALMIFFLPETSHQAILMKKAQHLRKLTGNPNIKAPGDIGLENMTLSHEISKAIWLPIKICLHEPILDLVNLHMCLIYSVIYLFFEAYPIVFVGIYNFTLVQLGVTYAVLSVPIALAVFGYTGYLDRHLVKPYHAGTPKKPEVSYGYPAVFGSVCVSIGLFIFGWSATPSAHWMGPIIGSCIFAAGTFLLFQTYISYIGTLYPTVFASAIASNTVLRSFVGGAFPLFGNVFYNHTATERWPVGWGSSILGFCGAAMVALPLYFIARGPKLREAAHARWDVNADSH